MKTLIFAATLLGVATSAVAQEAKDPYRLLVDRQSATVNSQMMVFTDPGTGCEYLLLSGSNRAAMTPRLNKRGYPVCPNLTAYQQGQ